MPASAVSMRNVTCFSISTGDNANAVVLTDIPPGATAVGVPAVVKPARGRWDAARRRIDG